MVNYADGPTTAVEADIAASPDIVWPFIADINTPAKFSQELQKAEWIDEGPAVGATFRGFNKHDLVGEWDVVCTLTGYESNEVFEWTVGDPVNKVARWRFDLESVGDGSKLRFTAEMGPGPSGLTPAIEAMPDREEDIVEGRLGEWNANMQLTVDGIKALAEAGTA